MPTPTTPNQASSSLMGAWVVVTKYRNGNECVYGSYTIEQATRIAAVLKGHPSTKKVQILPFYDYPSEWERRSVTDIDTNVK